MTDTVFFKHNYITQTTLTPEDAIVNAPQDFKHEIKEMKNQKGNKDL